MAGYLCLATSEIQEAKEFPDLGSPPFLVSRQARSCPLLTSPCCRNAFKSMLAQLPHNIFPPTNLSIDDWQRLKQIALQGFLVISASQAFLLNLCIFWCTTVNSPLATTVGTDGTPAFRSLE